MADQFASLWSPFGDDVSVRWLITVLHFLWQGALVGGIVAIAGSLLRSASSRFRYGLYSAALLSLPVCAAVTFCVVEVPVGLQSTFQLERPVDPPTKLSDRSSNRTAITAAVPMETVEAVDAPVVSQAVVSNAASMQAADDNSESRSRSSPALLPRAAPWIAGAYVGVVACFLLRLLVALWGGHRLRTQTARVKDVNLLTFIADQSHRMKLKCVPVVAYCERVAVPTVVGVLRPMVLLPVSLMTGLSPEDFAAILLHELAHIRRYDLWMNLMQRVIESLLFFHPVVWYVSRRLSAEREVCCDDLVVSTGYEPVHYAGALLRMAELCALSRQLDMVTLAATGNNRSLLERRIERLMNWSATPRLQLTRAGIAGLLMALASLIVVPCIAHTWAQAQGRDGSSKSNAQPELVDATTKKVGPQIMREPTFRLPDHWIMLAVGFDHNDTELITVSTQSVATIRRWDVAGRKLKSEIKLVSDKPGRSFRHDTAMLSGDRRRVIAATDDWVGIWDTATGELLKMLPFPKREWEYDCIQSLACTPDLSVIVGSLGTTYDRTTLIYDAHTIVWDGMSGEVLQTITHQHMGGFRLISLSPDGGLLAIKNGNGASIWDTTTGDRLLAIGNDNSGRKHFDPEVSSKYTDNVWSIQFSPSGKQLAIGDILGVKILDAQSGELLRQLEGPYRYSSFNPKLVFSADGQLLARTGTKTGKDYIVPIWSTQTGEMLHELHTDANDGAFSADGQLFAVAFSDFKTGLAVWQLSGSDPNGEQATAPIAEASIDTVAENAPFRGKKAAEFIDNWSPAWGDEKLGIQCGIAVTRPQRQFSIGERVPLAMFVRNVSDKPLQIDMGPNFLWDTSRVVDAQGTAVEFQKVDLRGTTRRYTDKLAPGEAFGPLYLDFGLGENPRPGKQNWFPYWTTPAAGKYTLTHALAINVADQIEDNNSTKWKGARRAEITSGQIEFEIFDGLVQIANPQRSNDSGVDGLENTAGPAKQLAITAHSKASAIDELPQFLIQADAGTLASKVISDPSPDPLTNLLRALDEPTVEADWFRFQKTFAWDNHHFVDEMYTPNAAGPDQTQATGATEKPPVWNTRWGTAKLSGAYTRAGEKPASHVLRATAADMWKSVLISNPNYILATTHEFWWGDNSERNQCFNQIPPQMAEYRLLNSEKFDGEMCDVVESPIRQERLWISQATGLLRGYAQFNYRQTAKDFYASEAVRQITGRTFATQSEYSQWRREEPNQLPRDKQLQLSVAWANVQDFQSARASLLVRFRDYRTIAPGIEWPFIEDRAQGGYQRPDGVECMVSQYRVQRIRTDMVLTEMVSELQPKEGEKVQDQRFAVPVDYQYRADRTETEILALVDVRYRKQLEDKRYVDGLKQGYQQLVGKPAPTLPEEGWLGGPSPVLDGQPYLIHFWAVWCGPCKNDYPLLRQLADSGSTIIGLHPGGSSADEVTSYMKENDVGHPTFLTLTPPAQGTGNRILDYPAVIFPYYILVDAKGIVVHHGSLREDEGALLVKLRELRRSSNPDADAKSSAK